MADNTHSVNLTADTVRQILDALAALSESVQAVKSMALGGEYEDTSLWEVDRIVTDLRRQIDGGLDR